MSEKEFKDVAIHPPNELGGLLATAIIKNNWNRCL